MRQEPRGPVFASISFLMTMIALGAVYFTWIPLMQGTDYLPLIWLVIAALPVFLPPPALVLGILAIRANRSEGADAGIQAFTWVGTFLAGGLTTACIYYVGLGMMLPLMLGPFYLAH